MIIRAAVVDHPIEVERLIAEVAAGTNGATAVFLGTVRASNEGREVTGIDYSAYTEMAAAEMQRILEEAGETHGMASAVIEHRIGTLEIGEVSIAVVTAAAHRRPALDALNYIIEETKARAPIWKLEHYSDGTREWVGAAAR
jgi:molybdopterin synthase catalytic subunit